MVTGENVSGERNKRKKIGKNSQKNNHTPEYAATHALTFFYLCTQLKNTIFWRVPLKIIEKKKTLTYSTHTQKTHTYSTLVTTVSAPRAGHSFDTTQNHHQTPQSPKPANFVRPTRTQRQQHQHKARQTRSRGRGLLKGGGGGVYIYMQMYWSVYI